MLELIDTMENLYGELVEICFEHGIYKAFEGNEVLGEDTDFDRLTDKLYKMGFRF